MSQQQASAGVNRHFAHSLPGQPPEHWEPLEQHLQEVSQAAGEFAAAFGAREWGQTLGLWHDLGKYSAAFQQKILHENGFDVHTAEVQGQVDHSTAGAQHAHQALPRFNLGMMLAYCLAGHHAGLPDATDGGGAAGLDQRLVKPIPSWTDAPAHLLTPPQLTPPTGMSFEKSSRPYGAFQQAFFTRMLFSALVDADFLQTEHFCNTGRSAQRQAMTSSLADLDRVLTNHLDELAAAAKPSPVNKRRAEIRAACEAAAKQSPGLFSLSVPTGGGKTLASLLFALRHAQQHRERGLRRVVVAIPFTSIIEQTAEEYRRVFRDLGDGVVLEHHSNFDLQRETTWSRLASENWDAPLVVTTNVQLFESLFAFKTRRCRKLHRLAGSVIILDEAQTLPAELLEPTLAAIRELVRNYGCSIVLCTATQPALEKTDEFPIGLEGVREIIPQPVVLAEQMRRVRVHPPAEPVGPQDLANRLSKHSQVLCIVNTRNEAAELFSALKHAEPGSHHSAAVHLSAAMCPAHRTNVLTEVRRRLAPESSEPCQVVSTQLIEAGVDVDFPVVYRSLAGFDSIAQAAGRCNREGRLPDLGDVYVFRPLKEPPPGYLQQTAQQAHQLIDQYPDPLAPTAIRAYFHLYYWREKQRWDGEQVMSCFSANELGPCFKFRVAAEKYRWIEEDTVAVLIPWEEQGQQLAARVRSPTPPDRETFRQAQRYTVSVRQRVYQALVQAGAVTETESLAVLTQENCYDKHLGLRPELVGILSPGGGPPGDQPVR